VRRRVLPIVCSVLLAVPAHGSAASIAPGEKLSLERAIDIALREHPARKEAQAQAGAATERIGEARAALLPQVYGVGEYLRATDNGIGDTAYLPALGIDRAPSNGRNTNQLSQTFDNVVGGLSAFQFLFDFGRTRGLVEQRSAEADAQDARLQLVQLDLVFGVAKAFYDLLAAKQTVTVYEKAVAQRTDHLREAQVKATAGLRPDIDATTADADLARAQLRLVDARNGASTAKAALDNSMGLGETAPDYEQEDVPLPEKVTGELPTYLAEAMQRRPDMQLLLDEARAAGARIDEVRSDYLPTVGAAAGYNVRGHDATPANNYYAGVLLSWPIFNGFLTDHELSEAKLHEEAVGHAIANLRQRITFEVKRSFLDWQAALERIRKAEKALDASKLELELAEKRYEKGLGSIIELTDAERRFTEDSADLVGARASFAVAKAALERDTGSAPPGSSS
jgi:outer membrane protein